MSTLIILNEAPYGSERSYNGLRLARALSNTDNHVTLFLLADAVTCAKTGQKVPKGFYNIELMVKSIIRNGKVLMCGACMDARGLTEEELIEGTARSTMEELSTTTLSSQKVLVF